ncbi:FAD synthase [Methanocella sp. CWC-04]|uniref:FAD synthase n=1 Tax=Methanooceanicella nereidis TaxID=2052831 RepID=A0AAP2RF86_9EURY|nr:FAD synthase [Methanocella sp. CWC-04]
MKKVVATGTFDILHPGHVLYLSEAKRLGDVLYVIVARDSTIKHKRKPMIPEEQRLFMVRSLKCVDCAILGSDEDMFKPIREIDPDIIALGFNQHWDKEELQKKLKEQGIRAEVVRIDRSDPSPYASSRHIRQKIRESDP